MYKPFRRTDQIAVSGMEGTVQEVNLRYTVLRADGQTIYVPNSILFTNAITVGVRAVPPAAT
jgi:small-conductance mechanosensitive channel